MNQMTLSASAPALVIALLVVTATPAVALVDTVKDTADALPRARDAPRHAEEASDACITDPVSGCTGAANERVDAWSSPGRAWVNAFREDPRGVLVAEVTGLGGELADVAGTFTTWLGGKLEAHGLPNPFGGAP